MSSSQIDMLFQMVKMTNARMDTLNTKVDAVQADLAKAMELSCQSVGDVLFKKMLEQYQDHNETAISLRETISRFRLADRKQITALEQRIQALEEQLRSR